MVDPVEDRGVVRAQLEALLVEDARKVPAFAMARKNAVLAGYEAATTRAPSRFVSTTAERFLRALHTYEAMRGGARTPSAKGTAFAEQVFSAAELSAYERARHLSLPVYPARPAPPPDVRRPLDAPRFPPGLEGVHPQSLLEAMAFAKGKFPVGPATLALTYLMGWMTPSEIAGLSPGQYEVLALVLDGLRDRVNGADDAWALGALANRLGTATLTPDLQKRIQSLRHWAGTFAHRKHEPDPYPHAETLSGPMSVVNPAPPAPAQRESALSLSLEYVAVVLNRGHAIGNAVADLEGKLTATAWTHLITAAQRTELVQLLVAISQRVSHDTAKGGLMERLTRIAHNCPRADLSDATMAQLRTIQNWRSQAESDKAKAAEALEFAVRQVSASVHSPQSSIGMMLRLLEDASSLQGIEGLPPYWRTGLMTACRELRVRITRDAVVSVEAPAQRTRLIRLVESIPTDLLTDEAALIHKGILAWRIQVEADKEQPPAGSNLVASMKKVQRLIGELPAGENIEPLLKEAERFFSANGFGALSEEDKNFVVRGLGILHQRGVADLAQAKRLRRLCALCESELLSDKASYWLSDIIHSLGFWKGLDS